MDVSGQIIKVLDDLGKRFGVAIDWSSKNVVPYIQDLLHRVTMYEIYTSIAWIILGIIGIIGCILVARWDYKNDFSDGELIFVPILIIIGCLCMIGVQVFDIIRCITIPETVWLEYIKQYTSLIK